MAASARSQSGPNFFDRSRRTRYMRSASIDLGRFFGIAYLVTLTLSEPSGAGKLPAVAAERLCKVRRLSAVKDSSEVLRAFSAT